MGAEFIQKEAFGRVIFPELGFVETGIGRNDRIGRARFLVGPGPLLSRLLGRIPRRLSEGKALDAEEQAPIRESQVGFDRKLDYGGLLPGVRGGLDRVLIKQPGREFAPRLPRPAV